MSIEYPVVVTLSRAYRLGNEEIAELKIHEEPPASAFYDFNLDPGQLTLGSAAPVMAKLYGVPPHFIGRLSLSDYNRAMDAVAPFFEQLAPTGGSA